MRLAINYILSLLLLFSLIMTGTTGYIQSALELRRFVPHKYFAYATLTLATLHVLINFRKIVAFMRKSRGSATLNR